MKYIYICFISFLLGYNNLFSQNTPLDIDYEYADYTLPEFKIISQELLNCMDTINVDNKNAPYMGFSFDFPELGTASLHYLGFLPAVYNSLYSYSTDLAPLGYFKYKKFLVFVFGQPIKGWFRKTGNKKYFYEKRKFYMPVLGGGDKIWYFNVENDKIVSVIQSIEE